MAPGATQWRLERHNGARGAKLQGKLEFNNSLNVCMVKIIFIKFVVYTRNFIIAKLSIREPGSSCIIMVLIIV
jgi:hypothetical protein